MAAEIGLAASVAGLVSLGIQLTGGITSFLDALKSRQEELQSVRRQNEALTAALNTIKTTNFQNQQHSYAITQSTKSCEEELRAVETLLAELANCDTSTWRKRLNSKKQELSYVFDRKKIQQLVQRLHHANEILQLTISGLGLHTLAAIETRSQAIEARSQETASELLLIRSEVAAVNTPITGVKDDVNRSHDSLQSTLETHLRKMEKMEKILGSLEITNTNTRRQRKALVLRAASKPAALKDLCDTLQAERQDLGQGPFSWSRPGRIQNLDTGSITGTICHCHRAGQFTTREADGIQWGHLYLSRKRETRDHWPSCPLANTGIMLSQKSTSLKFTGLTSILSSAIEITISMTTGSGGCSITPNLTYLPTVDAEADPAFRIIKLLERCLRELKVQGDRSVFVVACIRNMTRLFNEKKACPTAVDYGNNSLLHRTARALTAYTWRSFFSPQKPSARSSLMGLFQTLLLHGVPAFTYNQRGESPLAVLQTFTFEKSSYAPGQPQDAVNLLVQANSERLPAATNKLRALKDLIGDKNSYWLHLSDIKSLIMYSTSYDFAEAYGCGPLSMAVVRNDMHEVERLIHRPDSLSEVDILGHTPIHLAADKHRILALLVEVADISLLEKRSHNNMSALEQAMMLSSGQCLNGNQPTICQGCACTQCVTILLGAGCRARMQICEGDRSSPVLDWILREASELARRRYVYHMKELRDMRPQSHLLGRHPPKWEKEEQTYHKTRENYSWTFGEIDICGFAELIYRHGFHPDSSIFLKKSFHNLEYNWWLVEHGADLLLRSPIQPPDFDNDLDFGIYSAHYAYYIDTPRKAIPQFDFYEREAINKFSVVIMRKNLTDGCMCHCSVGGCSPFTWMMKRNDRMMDSNDITWFYQICSPEVAALTYESAIRYITFRALSLVHTCCNAPCPPSIWEPDGDEPKWMTKEDVHVINDEQASLLELHEKLVDEFVEAATPYLRSDSGYSTQLPQFLEEYWKIRMEGELEKLNGSQLTEAERQGAEDIGVRWCEEEVSNPYRRNDLEYWVFELDKICPEYREPWPEGMRQIEELP